MQTVGTRQRTTILARFAFLDGATPLENAVLTIDGIRIAACEPFRDQAVDIDLGDAAIIAPLVNAHTHLEFSDLKSPLRGADDSFASWIEAVVQYRRTRRGATSSSEDPVQQGLAELQASGCLQLGEIATDDALPPGLPPSAVGGIRFRELIGVSKDRSEEQMHRAAVYVDSFAHAGNFQPGLSPHAPYSVSMDLVKRIARLSQVANVPLAMHLAETEEELRLLRQHDGPLAEFLLRMGIWPPAHVPIRTRPLDYLKVLAGAARTLVIHGNYLDEEALGFLAEHRDRMTLVYCPRTHAFFEHPPWPLQRAYHLGVRIALGTDSRASNPDLSVWHEALYIAEHHPEFPRAELLRTLTLFGCEALYGKKCGLRIGSPASFCVVGLGSDTLGLPPAERDDPWIRLFSAMSRPQEIWQNGERMSRRPMTP